MFLFPHGASRQEGTLKKEYIAMFLIRIVFHLLRKWNISWEMTGLDQRQASRHIVGRGFPRQRLLTSREIRMPGFQTLRVQLQNLEQTDSCPPPSGDLGRVAAGEVFGVTLQASL